MTTESIIEEVFKEVMDMIYIKVEDEAKYENVKKVIRLTAEKAIALTRKECEKSDHFHNKDGVCVACVEQTRAECEAEMVKMAEKYHKEKAEAYAKGKADCEASHTDLIINRSLNMDNEIRADERTAVLDEVEEIIRIHDVCVTPKLNHDCTTIIKWDLDKLRNEVIGDKDDKK